MIRTKNSHTPKVIAFDKFKIKTCSELQYLNSLPKNLNVKDFRYRMIVRSIINKKSAYKIVIKILQKKSKELWIITNWGELNIKNLQYES